jgi:hypothetical protein
VVNDVEMTALNGSRYVVLSHIDGVATDDQERREERVIWVDR